MREPRLRPWPMQRARKSRKPFVSWGPKSRRATAPKRHREEPMTTNRNSRTSPAANAGLPAIDRRSLVCGLGTAAVAGIPGLASAAPMGDPVFQAMAALAHLKIHAEEQDAAHSVAEGAIMDANIASNIVTLDGEE